MPFFPIMLSGSEGTDKRSEHRFGLHSVVPESKFRAVLSPTEWQHAHSHDSMNDLFIKYMYIFDFVRNNLNPANLNFFY